MSSPLRIQKKAQLTGHEAAIFALSEGRSDQHFLSGAGDGWVVEWDLAAPDMGRLVAKVETQLFALKMLEGRNRVVGGNMNGGVHWIDLDNPKDTKNIAHHKKGVFAIEQIGDYLYTIGGDGMLTRWAIDEARSIESIHLSNKALRSLAYDPIGNELAIGSSDCNIYLINLNTWTVSKTILKAHENSVFSIAYSPGGNYLLSGGRDAQLKVWDRQKEHALHMGQSAHWYTINRIIFHPTQNLFATASRDKTIKLWDSTSFQLLKVLEGIRDGGHLNSVNTLFWSAYKNSLISASDDRSMIVWEVELLI